MRNLLHIFAHSLHAYSTPHSSPLRYLTIHPTYTLLGAVVLTVTVGTSLHNPSSSLQTAGASTSATQPSSVVNVPVNTPVPPSAPIANASNGSNVSSDDSSNANTNSVSVTVNGQDIPVPENGTVEQTTTSPDGSSQTSIKVSGTQATTGTSYSSSITSVHSHVSSDNNLNVHTNVSQESP